MKIFSINGNSGFATHSIVSNQFCDIKAHYNIFPYTLVVYFGIIVRSITLNFEVELAPL